MPLVFFYTFMVLRKETRKETNMFKIGDIVAIKQLKEAERVKYPYYHQLISCYNGQNGVVLETGELEILVKFSDGFLCWWLKDWVIPATQYNAF